MLQKDLLATVISDKHLVLVHYGCSADYHKLRSLKNTHFSTLVVLKVQSLSRLDLVLCSGSHKIKTKVQADGALIWKLWRRIQRHSKLIRVVAEFSSLWV